MVSQFRGGDYKWKGELMTTLEGDLSEVVALGRVGAWLRVQSRGRSAGRAGREETGQHKLGSGDSYPERAPVAVVHAASLACL